MEGGAKNKSINYKDIELLIECINNIIYVKYNNILLLTNFNRSFNSFFLNLNVHLPTSSPIYSIPFF